MTVKRVYIKEIESSLIARSTYQFEILLSDGYRGKFCMTNEKLDALNRAVNLFNDWFHGDRKYVMNLDNNYIEKH